MTEDTGEQSIAAEPGDPRDSGFVLVWRRTKGRRSGMGGATLHRVGCGYLRPLTDTRPVSAEDAARYARTPTVPCRCVPRDLVNG